MKQARPLGKRSESILKVITSGLKVGQSRTYDNYPRSFMAAHVERISPNTYSVAHYYEQQGDLVPDPDLVLWKGPAGHFWPASLQQATGLYTEALRMEDDQPTAFHPQTYAELVYFTNLLLKNISRQQGGISALRTTGVMGG